MSPALQVRDVHKRFGGITVLTGASLDVPRGSITALIGSNGAGKSTLLNVVSGLIKQDSGDVLLHGENISTISPYMRARKGLTRTFQHVRSFTTFTVREAIEFAAMPAAEGNFGQSILWIAGARRNVAKVPSDEILTRCRLESRANAVCGSLSYGETKLLMLAQSLAFQGSVQCFDELCAGLEPELTVHVQNVLRELASSGTTVLFIEHNLQVVRDLSQQCIFLHEGQAFRQGPTGEVLEDPEVVRLYLGQ